MVIRFFFSIALPLASVRTCIVDHLTEDLSFGTDSFIVFLLFKRVSPQ